MRCFIAIEVTSGAAKALQALQEECRKTGVLASYPKEFHCTLAFFPDAGEEEIKKIINAMKELNARSFTIVIEGTGFFPNDLKPRVFWAGVKSKELMEIQKTLAAKLGVGEPFSPHITIARTKKSEPLKDLRLTTSKETIKKIVLKKSVLTPNGPVYEDVFVKELP